MVPYQTKKLLPSKGNHPQKEEAIHWQGQEITSVVKDLKKRELFYTVDRNVNWCSHYGNQYRGSPQIKNMKYPEIPLLGTYLKKMKTLIKKDT